MVRCLSSSPLSFLFALVQSPNGCRAEGGNSGREGGASDVESPRLLNDAVAPVANKYKKGRSACARRVLLLKKKKKKKG